MESLVQALGIHGSTFRACGFYDKMCTKGNQVQNAMDECFRRIHLRNQ